MKNILIIKLKILFYGSCGSIGLHTGTLLEYVLGNIGNKDEGDDQYQRITQTENWHSIC